MKINGKLYTNNDYKLAILYNDLDEGYHRKGELNEVLLYLTKAVELMLYLKSISWRRSKFGYCMYNKIGLVYENREEYEKMLKYL